MMVGGPVDVERELSLGWHDTSVNAETGAFAVAQQNAGLDDLIGEILRVTVGNRVVYVYVLDIADVPVQLSLARRPFAALARLSLEAITAKVVPVG